MKKRVCAAGALFLALALAMALPCAPALAQEQGQREQARKTDHAEPKPVQQGILTNEKLQRDAMMGVAAKRFTVRFWASSGVCTTCIAAFCLRSTFCPS